MLKISIKPDKTKENGLVGLPVKEATGNKISPDTIICDENGKALIIFGKFKTAHLNIKKGLPLLKYNDSTRLTRMKNNFKNQESSDLSFGFKQFKNVFNQPASACISNSKYPAFYDNFVSLGQELMGLYEKYDEERFQRQSVIISQINERWRIPGTIFTQGIVNNSAALDYHFDRGNIRDCWSCMAVFRRGTVGGDLVIPSLNAHLDIQDETFVLFNGQNLLHGVSPIKKTSPNGGRYSLVFYALEQMLKLGTFEEEIDRIRKTDLSKHKKNTKKG